MPSKSKATNRYLSDRVEARAGKGASPSVSHIIRVLKLLFVVLNDD